MSQHRSIPLPLVGAILLGLLAGLSLLAWKWLFESDSSAPVTKHPIDTPPEDALKYWTRERMRKAKGTNMPHIDVPDRGKKHPRASHPHPSQD
jgi:hypothetical protein